jgi:hypothetical protein
MERLQCQSALEEEFLDVEEEILDVMETENLRDAEREITMLVYSATHSGKGINHRTDVRSMVWMCNDAVQYDRELCCKIDRRVAQCALELVNHRMKIER